MRLPYHPILVFGLIYVIGLLMLLCTLGLLGMVAEPAVIWLTKSGWVNILPLPLAFLAAWCSATMKAGPLFRFVGHNPKAVRASFKKHLIPWACAFGLAAVVIDLAAVVATAIMMGQDIHYPMLRLLAVAGVYGFISYEAIKASFGVPLAPEAETLCMEDPETVLRPVRTDEGWDR